MRVLLVEDNPADQLLIRKALIKARPELDVRVAGDGADAISVLRSTDLGPRPDFVLLDLKLARMSGLDVLRELKHTPLLRRIPVFVLSSSDAPADVASSYDNQANGYITKDVFTAEASATRLLDFMDVLQLADSADAEHVRLSPLMSEAAPPERVLADIPNPQLLAAIVESSADAIISLDLEGRIRSWNRAAEQLYGYSAGEAVGRDIRLIVSQDRVPDLYDILACVRRGETGQSLETVRIDGSGEQRFISLVISPIRDRLDRVIGAATIARDITSNKLADERFRLAVESSPNAMVMCDGSGITVLANAEAERLFGYTRNELVGQSIDILVPQGLRSGHPKHRADFMREPAARAMGAGRDLRAVRKDGTELPVEIGLNPIDTPEGTFVLAAIVDISERKQAEERFRLAVEASPNGHVMVDREGRIVLVNAEAERMFGYSRVELIGRFASDLVPERFRGQHPRHQTAFLKRPATRPMGAGRDLYAVRKDGTEIPVEIGLNPIDTPEGTFVLAAVVDITERKQAEQVLASQARALARSNEELEQFAYVASHDLREPLRTISSFAKILREEYGSQLEGDAEKYVHFMLDASQRMQQLIGDLLAYARLSTRLEELVAVDLAHAVKVATDNLRVRIEEAAAEVSVGALPTVSGNESQLTELFQNLIANAIKFRSDAAPRIEIGARRQGEVWTVSVRDNGIGVPAEHRESVFQVFRRLHFREEYEGTGIGLALCKRIVERHGGRIWLEPANGDGTTVQFTLPCARRPRESDSRRGGEGA